MLLLPFYLKMILASVIMDTIAMFSRAWEIFYWKSNWIQILKLLLNSLEFAVIYRDYIQFHLRSRVCMDDFKSFILSQLFVKDAPKYILFTWIKEWNFSTIVADIYFLRPEKKGALGFFALSKIKFWEKALFFKLCNREY